MTSLNEMTLPELVTEFNAIALSDAGQEIGLREVKKFKDKETAVARIERAHSSIKAHKEGLSGGKTAKAAGKRTRKPRDPNAPKAERKPRGAPKEPREPKRFESAFGSLTKGSNREKLLDLFLANLGEPVSTEQMLVAVYGDASAKASNVKMVLKGLKMLIESRELPYEIVKKEKDFVLRKA